MADLFTLVQTQKNIVKIYSGECCLVEVRGPWKPIIVNKMGENAVLIENEWREFVVAIEKAIILAKF